MPYMLSENGLCVHKENADGSLGEKIKCHENHADALAQMQAMNIAYQKESMKALSFEDRERAIGDAVQAMAGPRMMPEPASLYVTRTYDNYVIICAGSEYFEADYSLNPDGTATIAPREQWRPVSQEWVAKFKAERYGGTPRAKLEDSDFVFPDERAFPIMTSADVPDAVSSWGRYKGTHSFEDFKRRLTAIAKRKGFEESLPEEWTKQSAAKYAIKVAGDWTIDILAVPFGTDSDGQVIDESTDIMPDTFSSPAIIYHHGIEPGSGGLQPKPAIIGKSQRIEKRNDGWHVIAVLDKAIKWAKDVWEAAKQGLAVASSDSISHLARLEVDGKTQMYNKNQPGRIAVWPLAGVSIWNLAQGNMLPASRNAIALPAMKAIYQEAGIPFPVIKQGYSENDEPEADKAARIARKNLQKQARRIISTWTEPE